jgi:hypothetical protein
MKPYCQKYVFRMIAGFLAYALGLFALNYFYSPQLPHKYWLILLPVLPLVYVSATIIRCIADADEMWRKIYTEALAFSALATGFTCFSYLFVRDMGAPEFRAEWAFYLMWAYYGIGLFVSWRRYN